jgi:arylsulfatase A-like enzyme
LRALVPRLGLAGALAGCACALVDFASCASRLGPFLPTGPLRFCGFLIGLYGLGGALAGLLLGLIALALDQGDLGAARRGTDAPGGRLVAYVLVAVLALVAGAVSARLMVEQALLLFHNRPLIGALSGATAVGAALGVGLLGLAIVPLLSRLLPLGPRITARFRGAPIAALPCLILGGYLAAGLIAAHVLFLAGRPRMTHPVRALNAALAAPAAIALGLACGWVGYRLLGRGGRAQRRPGYTAVVLAALAALALPPALAAAMTWATTRQLDLRPFLGGGAILAGALLLARPLRGRRVLLPLLAITPVLLLLLFGLGRVPRVRKATSLVGLAPHLVRGIQLATDLDGDGYSSVLGGGDCNDLDRRVHPGAFDWPDDSIDQDCNGHQATLAPRPPRVYAPVPDAVPAQPNVLLITLDALRADHVSAYGYNRHTTPNLDALAQAGVRFEHGWAHAPSTRYSVPAILSGRYPSTIAVNNDPRVHWPPQVLPENRMLAEMLKDLGYRTAATLSYHYFERGWGLDQGFDDYDYHLYTLHSVGGDPAATSGSSARQLADLDIAWLTAHKDERFFLWTHFYDTHFRFERHPDLPESDFGGDELALYDGEIRYSDHHLGRVLDALKALGLWDRTIVIVTADHGDGFGEHGIPMARRHGYHLYRTETQVPVIVRVPGLPPRVVDTPIGHIDLIPTLLNLLRRPPSEEPQLLGDSLLAAMLGDESQRDTRAIYQEVWFEGPTSLKALATRGWHLIRNLVPSDTTELYDLDKDPGEEHDLSGLGETIEAQLLARLGEITDALAIPAGFAEHMKDALSRTPRAPQRPLDDTVGDWLRVTGADLDVARVTPGQSATVTVHFEVRRPIPEGWILFTHATGAMGRAMNLDHAPVEGLVPLQTLEPGQSLRDPIRVAVPVGWPAGPLRIELGLYRKGSRAPAHGAHSAGDAVTVATLEVAPPR